MLIGAGGQLATDLVQVLRESGEDILALTQEDLDITNVSALRGALAQYRPEVVLNCSVYHPVDDCEVHAEQSFAVNALAVRDLGLAAKDSRAVVVHFSSDYVFDGELGHPYREEDTPNPTSVFGVSKLAGELLLRAVLPRHFIIRTSGLYGLAGSRVKRGNFVETMLRLGSQKGRVRVVNDLRIAPTYTRNLAKQVYTLLGTEHFGTYHASDHGDYSWFEFAQKIFAYASLNVEVTPVSWREMPMAAPRPRYSVLENGRLKALGLDQMQAVDVALQAYLRSRPVDSAHRV
jgi:dTDP-4-dehydrorhamnose reductase